MTVSSRKRKDEINRLKIQWFIQRESKTKNCHFGWTKETNTRPIHFRSSKFVSTPFFTAVLPQTVLVSSFNGPPQKRMILTFFFFLTNGNYLWMVIIYALCFLFLGHLYLFVLYWQWVTKFEWLPVSQREGKIWMVVRPPLSLSPPLPRCVYLIGTHTIYFPLALSLAFCLVFQHTSLSHLVVAPLHKVQDK